MSLPTEIGRTFKLAKCRLFHGSEICWVAQVGIDKDEVEEGGGPERGEFEGAVSSFSSARFPRQSSVQTAREWTADFCALARNSKAR